MIRPPSRGSLEERELHVQERDVELGVVHDQPSGRGLRLPVMVQEGQEFVDHVGKGRLLGQKAEVSPCTWSASAGISRPGLT